jgi:hypothetical protein
MSKPFAPRPPRRHLIFVLCLAFTLLLCPMPPASAAEAMPLAVFDFELIDTSLEGETQGPRADEQARIGMISDQLRQLLADTGRYRIIDLAPVQDKIDAAGYIHGCNGCDTKIAGGLGAERAVTGTVQKVSNLILNINLYEREVASGKLLRAMSVDIRGNTDKSWSRGVSYLVRNRFLKGAK